MRDSIASPLDGLQSPFGSRRASLAALIRALFRDGEQGTLIDPLDATTLFQERTGASATTPAIPGDPVGTILDKSGNGNHATAPSDAARPLLQEDAQGRRYLQSNGVDSVLEFPSGTLVYGPSEVWLGYRYEAGAEFSSGFRNEGGGDDNNRFTVAHSAVSFGDATFTSVEPREANVDYVIGGSVAGTGTTTQTAFRVGSTPKTRAVTRAAVGGNFNLFSAFSDFAQMRFYGGLVIDRVLTEKERENVQRYLAQKSGVDYP